MKRLLFVVASIGLLFSSPAGAQSGFYVGIDGGGIFFFDQSFDTDVVLGGVVLQDAGDVDVSYETGHGFSGHLGYQLDTNIRLEVEGGYAFAEGERRFSFDDLEAETDQDVRILQAAAGIYFDLWPLGIVVPYVGGGIGYANVLVDNEEFGEAEQNVFMAFIEGGVPYNLTPSLSFAPSLRFNWYRTEETLAEDFRVPIIGDNLYNLDLRLGASYAF